MNKLYSRIGWENYPSEKTPLNESNLNKIDNAVDALDDRAIEIDTKKLDLVTANTMVKDVGVNSSNGVITVTYLNGAKATFDTNLEKIALNFIYDAGTQRIILTLTDGTKQYIDLSALITEYEFEDSSTVAFEVVSGKVIAKVKNGSITGDMLRPNYLADITVQAQKALQSANDSGTQAEAAQASAVRSEAAAKKAEDITGVSIATNDNAGIIKGNTDEFAIDAQGKLSLTSSFTAQSALTAITGAEDKKTLFGKLAKGVSSLISHISDKAVHFTLTNNLLATAAGTALDAAQGKALDDKIADVNRKLTSKSGIANKGAKFSADTPYVVKNGICFAICEAAPNSPVVHGDIFCSGLPEPTTGCYLSLNVPNGNYSALLKPDGTVIIYYPLYTQPERIDCCFSYPIK